MLAKQSSIKNPKSTPQTVPWQWFPTILICLLALIGADVVLALVLGAVGAPESGSVTANFLFYAASRLLGLSFIWLYLRRYRANWRQLGFRQFKFWRSIGLVIASAILLLVASTAIFVIAEKAVPSFNLEQEQEIVFTSAQAGTEQILAFVALVIVAPIAEEIIFRGLLLPSLAQRFNFGWGALISAALFGVVHWQVNVGILTFIMGLLLAWLYKKTGSLWPAILFHSLKNLVAFALIF